MDVTFDGKKVTAGPQAREQFYDSRGYGRPRDGDLELAPVEAAHLLFRGDLKAVIDRRPQSEGEGETRLGFNEFLASTAVSEVAFFVYTELRNRGFYLAPVRHLADDATQPTAIDGSREFVVYPRGQGPWDDEVLYRVLAVSEREDVCTATLQAIASQESTEGDSIGGVLAVVDEESEVTYLEVDEPTIAGSSFFEFAQFSGTLLSDRVLVPDPPNELYDTAFYGQRIDRDRSQLQLSLVEAGYLTEQGCLEVISRGIDMDEDTDGHTAVVERGREVEGERFDQRLQVYSALRTAGIVPKTGFKFGADFRTYANVKSVDDLGHSELLIRVVSNNHVFTPRDLALDVRLAHGVRKKMVMALTDKETIEWLSVERLTP